MHYLFREHRLNEPFEKVLLLHQLSLSTDSLGTTLGAILLYDHTHGANVGVEMNKVVEVNTQLLPMVYKNCFQKDTQIHLGTLKEHTRNEYAPCLLKPIHQTGGSVFKEKKFRLMRGGIFESTDTFSTHGTDH